MIDELTYYPEVSRSLLAQIAACAHSDPQRKSKVYSGRWTAVTMRTELWEQVKQAAGTALYDERVVVQPRPKLPRMTDPLGKGWRQPANLRDIVQIFDTHAMLPEAVFFDLPNYESSLPSGVYPGKVWRRGRKFICWYGPGEKRCAIGRLRVLLT